MAIGNETAATVSPNNPGTPFFTADYYFGVILAIGCAVCGSLCNIAISRVGSDVSSAGLVFYSGLGGIVVAIVGSLADRQEDILFLKHPTLYVVHGRAKPVLHGPNSTEPNLFHHE